MGNKKKKRIATDGGGALSHNPFGGLDALGGLPEGAKAEPENPPPPSPARKRGRVDIIRQTAHRGGKAVIVVSGFKGIPESEKKELAKKIQKACGVGGTVKKGHIEIQGEQRDTVKRILEEAGFQPVFAGG